jgi:hypothetical protein
MAGDFPQGPFGLDPSIPRKPRGSYIAKAKGYDATKEDYDTDRNGRVVSMHPIDVGVRNAMFVQKGELRSSPSTGNTLLKLDSLGTDRLQSEVEGCVRASNPIARYLQEKRIEILLIESDFRASTGALLVSVTYRNRETQRTEIVKKPVRIFDNTFDNTFE